MPGRQPAAAAGDDDVDRRAQPHRLHLPPRLDPGDALPLDDPRIVEARHQHRAARFGQPRRDRLARFGGAVVADHFGTQRQRALDLGRGRVGGHHDRRRHAQPPRRPGHALRVIAARKRRRRPCAPLRFVERGQPVPGAANLERADRLQRFGLERDRRAADFRGQQRRRRQDLRHFRGRVAYPGSGRLSHHCHGSSPCPCQF